MFVKIPEYTAFKGKPDNYSVIDDYVSRSAQPKAKDFIWLKEQGVTDIFNFRSRDIDFNEKVIVKKLKMRYHAIPSVSEKPSEKNIERFLKELFLVIKRSGKAHIHCMAGADRTGMYAFIYKVLSEIGTVDENRLEWLQHGLNVEKYPELMNWAEDYCRKILSKKVKI